MSPPLALLSSFAIVIAVRQTEVQFIVICVETLTEELIVVVFARVHRSCADAYRLSVHRGTGWQTAMLAMQTADVLDEGSVTTLKDWSSSAASSQ